jgi:hypothetical protein
VAATAALIVPLLPPIPDYNEQEHQSKDEVIRVYEVLVDVRNNDDCSKMSVVEATAINWRK